jgi:LmbE family N-acetylglucosaminyl deacetylase
MAGDAHLPRGRVAVLSPHLDDVVFSLGASISAAARDGCDVQIVTVLAGDPASNAEAGAWDRRCGFATHADSVRRRREEDRRACAILGATPVWLPFNDEQYDRGGADDEIWSAVLEAVAGAGAVLCPGYPLRHPDHAWLARLCLERGAGAARLGLYVEQPYTWQTTGAPEAVPEPLVPLLAATPDWLRLSASPAALLAKTRAAFAYRSQLARIPRRLLLRVVAHEVKRRGEAIAWPDPA